MKFEGDVKVIQDIESVIKRCDCHAIKSNMTLIPVRSSLRIKPEVITRQYRVTLTPFYFDIRLCFDYRDGTGEFSMKDRDSQFLFVKVPQIPKLLSRLEKMVYHYEGAPEKTEVAL